MKNFLALLILIPIIFFSGCGGGTSSSTTEIPTSITPIPLPTTDFIYTELELLRLANSISSLRKVTSAGKLVQQTQLDLAAKKHSDYLVKNSLTSNGSFLYSIQQNGQWGGHYESALNLGFSGSTPQARADSAGYVGIVNELAVFGAKSELECVASLENSAYHIIHILSPFEDMGVSFNSGNVGDSVCIVLLGVATSSPGVFVAANQNVVYPARNQVNVAPIFYNQAERPNPAPDLLIAGHPVLISFYNLNNKSLSSKDVVIHAFNLVSNTGNQIPLRILTFPDVQSSGIALVSDRNIPAPGYVVALPTQPLSSDSTYKVKVSASIAGNPITQEWAFTTGSIN
jgi:hypothetical protein